MDVRDLGGAVWRHKLLVLLVLVVTAIAVATGLALAPRSYSATATVAARADEAVDTGRDDPEELRGTLAELADSRSVVRDVQGELSVPRDVEDLRHEIRGSRVVGTILLTITVSDRDPVVAAEIANAVARVLPLHDPTRAFVFDTTDRAEPPATPSSPDPRLAIAVGAALTLVLAGAGALLRDRRTNTVDDGAAVEESTSAPLLAHLAPPRDPTTLPALHPGTPAADDFRHLRAALEAEVGRSPVGKVVVADVTSGEVNVWLGANIAIALADVGHRVLLVDGRMGERFGRRGPQEPDTPGLHDVLTGTPLVEALSPGPTEGLTVLPAGGWGAELSESLIEHRFGEAMAQAQSRFDIVVVLAPPLDVCDHARVLAAGGSLLLVVTQGTVVADVLRAHADRVRAVGARILGVVLVGRRTGRVSL